MKTTFTFLAWVVALAGSVTAAPVTFNEISLLVRMREADAYMTQQLAQRRLLHALTPGQEAALKAQGASDALLQALRKPDVVFSAEEAAAFERWSEQQRLANEKRIAEDTARHEALLARQAALVAQAEEARARTDAETAAATAAFLSPGYSYDYGYAPYYGGYYGGGYYGGGYYGGAIGSRPGCVDRPASFSATALQWQNGTSTIYTKPGLYYYPLGTNGGSNLSAPQSAPARGRSGTSISLSTGGGGGSRSRR